MNDGLEAVERARIHVEVAGQGEPTLLFVHGFGCTHEDWSAQMSGLADDFRCIAMDLPGHGASPQPGDATVVALAEAVNNVKASIDSNAVVLVAHSLGAKVIRESFSRNRDKVVGLVCIEGAYYDADRDVVVERARAAVDAEGFAAFAQRHFGAMFFNTQAPLKAQVLERVARIDPAYARSVYLDAVGWDPVRGLDTLREIDVPLLVIQSTYVDATLVRKPLAPGVETPFMAAARQHVRDVRFHVVKDSDHFPLINAAAEVNAAIRDFARAIAESRAEGTR
jgi:pimeloyl-ACP methyl ester carboxylesterase